MAAITHAFQKIVWTREELQELREDLVKSHISALLSPEKLPKEDWHDSARFVRATCVRAAFLLETMLDGTAAVSSSTPTKG